MTRQLARQCPRCNVFMSVKVLEPGRNARLQAVNGHCVRCAYRFDWIVIRGNRRSRPHLTRKHG